MLKSLELWNFRNYRRRGFQFAGSEVCFCGENGVGKSNLLEAIYFLSILRSFRAGNVRDLVGLGGREFKLRGVWSSGGVDKVLEVEQTLRGRRLAVDGVAVRKSSEFIREFRAVVFAPEDKLIAAGSSVYRRKFLDMLIGVLDFGYLAALQRYGVALAQRNAALRRSDYSEAAAAAFEPELAAGAAVIGPLRKVYLDLLVKEVRTFPGGEEFTVGYEPDYPEGESEYLAKLGQERERERRRGFSAFGPQTDDFVFSLGGRSLRSFGSNGQQRLISLYLKMAEFSLVARNSPGGVVALVDDVTCELDRVNRERFLRLLGRAEQSFYTFTEMPEDARFAGMERVELS